MKTNLKAILTGLCLLFLITDKISAQNLTTFEGEKSSWHGFDRYDYLMDMETMTIKPIQATPQEGTGMNDANTPKGMVRCIVIVPKTAAAGNPCTWRGFYWDHESQSEVELLKRGFHVVYINIDPDKHWDAWYDFFTKHGLSKKPAFSGMSRGGINEYAWATTHPDKVSCLYADNPAIRPESFAKLSVLVKYDIPVMSLVGTEDFLLPTNTLPIEDAYLRFGGRMTMMIKEGTPHHPHSIRNSKFIADWVEQNIKPAVNDPLFADTAVYEKTYYYNLENQYQYLKEENTYATVRGPWFTPTYAVYTQKIKAIFGIKGLTIIAPNKPAAGNPWVFRADRTIGRDATVEQALLAKGYYIVIPSITSQSGPVGKDWDNIYTTLIGKGFSKKPVMMGTSAYGGEAYEWAIYNPDKVSCIYTDNVAMRSLMEKKAPIDTLAPLAKAGIKTLHVSGANDPWLATDTRVAEQRYKALGGSMTVITIPGEGHFPKTPRDPAQIVSFIIKNTKE
ncbi:alpha/beta hydrolase [Mucilaginibacter corticis]|uniref:Alpha/beta hydrolase n=1 Tax=Mucilaginibacter corticis TaxID=2597670 RepID=A0A556MTS7_9SPHI|nr:alpha/beta hydrolase [Mucilaginibacter corticis]TSJ43188.1 alpha/beta hydrolase [Mucilaginibacter corticis]